MTVYTLKPKSTGVADPRLPHEILAAAAVAGWPDVLIQPEAGVVSYDDARNVHVVGAEGWAVFTQMMNSLQMLAARRLLLCLVSGQGAEQLVETADGSMIGPAYASVRGRAADRGTKASATEALLREGIREIEERLAAQ